MNVGDTVVMDGKEFVVVEVVKDEQGNVIGVSYQEAGM